MTLCTTARQAFWSCSKEFHTVCIHPTAATSLKENLHIFLISSHLNNIFLFILSLFDLSGCNICTSSLSAKKQTQAIVDSLYRQAWTSTQKHTIELTVFFFPFASRLRISTDTPTYTGEPTRCVPIARRAGKRRGRALSDPLSSEKQSALGRA